MPVSIRIRNVQSIRDATLRVEGFTVVTGPNNCGKTASQRAVRGVFTNASPGPLVRHGESHLTVDLTFDNGPTVRWEKGEKVNRYMVDGKALLNVGRGAPPEVAALGVSEVKAGSDRLWPQIAEQFGGVLFLVDRPGSVVAEALSDVDKVGRLTEALRLAESDKRSVGAELKVRRADVLGAEQELGAFDALPATTLFVETAEALLSGAKTLDAEQTCLHDLSSRKCSSEQDIRALSAAPVGCVPTPDEVFFIEGVRFSVAESSRLASEHARLKDEVAHLAQVANVVVPDTQHATILMSNYADLRALLDRLLAVQGQAQHAQDSHDGASGVKVPSSEVFARIDKARGILNDMGSLASRRKAALTEISTAKAALLTAQGNLTTMQGEVTTLLGDRGECPTCHTFCDTSHLSEQAG